jgi:hypothetical protein
MLLIVGHLLAQRNRINSPSFGKLTDRFLSIWDYSFNESYGAAKYIEREFDDFLRCGHLEHGFMRLVYGDCKHEKWVAFSLKRSFFTLAAELGGSLKVPIC